MSSDGGVEIPVLYLRWKVNTWNISNNSTYSSFFRFQGRKWRLKYYQHQHSDVHTCLLLEKKSEGCHAPFNVAVHLESGQTNRIMPELSKRTQIPRVDSSTCILEKRISAVQRADPEYRRTQELKFLVILKADDVLTETNSVHTQTECMVAEDTALLQREEHLGSLPCIVSLVEDFSKLLDQDSNPDIEIQCASASAKAHKVVLCARSPVLKAMLNSNMTEGSTGIIKIDDMDADIFRQFLNYLYTGKLPELDFDKALGLYEAGDKYSVLSLARRCSEYLKEHLAFENVCDVLIAADMHSDAKFLAAIIKYIQENKALLHGDCWKAFSDDHLKLANKVLHQLVFFPSK